MFMFEERLRRTIKKHLKKNNTINHRSVRQDKWPQGGAKAPAEFRGSAVIQSVIQPVQNQGLKQRTHVYRLTFESFIGDL